MTVFLGEDLLACLDIVQGGHVVSYRDRQVEMRMMSAKIRTNIDIDSMSSKLIIIGV